MTSFLDKLNLQPQERRWVVAIMVGVFVILNYVFVYPYFSEWGKVRAKMETAKTKSITFQREIDNDNVPNTGYKATLEKQNKTGPSIQLEGEIQLMKTVYAQAAASKVSVMNALQPTSAKNQTNDQFFEEQSVKITVDAEEKDLVDFLYTIGGDSSMIRVRDLALRPADNNRYRLHGTITLTASYQKKAQTKATPATNSPSATGRPSLVQHDTKTPPAPAAKKPGK